MVLDVQPVAHLLPVAVHRQRLAGEGIDDHQRDQLLGEVIGPVVVGAVGGEHRQAVGVVLGAHQVVARGLASRVGAVRLVRFVSVKAGASGRASRRPRRWRRAGSEAACSAVAMLPVDAHGFEQAERADDVGLEKSSGPWMQRSTAISAAKFTTAAAVLGKQADQRGRRCRPARRHARCP